MIEWPEYQIEHFPEKSMFSSIFQEFFRSKNRTSANFLCEVFFFRTETELKIRNEIERKMQDNQPNVLFFNIRLILLHLSFNFISDFLCLVL
jgi:hypothetical protein